MTKPYSTTFKWRKDTTVGMGEKKIVCKQFSRFCDDFHYPKNMRPGYLLRKSKIAWQY